jgi:hypothetical protein
MHLPALPPQGMMAFAGNVQSHEEEQRREAHRVSAPVQSPGAGQFLVAPWIMEFPKSEYHLDGLLSLHRNGQTPSIVLYLPGRVR